METEDGADSEYSHDDKKRAIRKRSRVYSMKNEKYKEKL